jgi:preprotein translocase subunit SecB
MDPTKAPGIRIDKILLEGFSFKKSAQLDLTGSYNVNVTVGNSTQHHEDGLHSRLLSTVQITEQTAKLFELELTYGLYAAIMETERNMSLADYMENNAPSILYQFSRETILTITQKAGIPLVIPPMNLSKLKEQ